MCSKSGTICCDLCDYKSIRSYNVKRHMVTKHTLINVNPTLINVNTTLENVNPTLENVNPTLKNVNPTLPHTNQCVVVVDSAKTCTKCSKTCTKCSKTFTWPYLLKAHVANCKGDVKKCPHCDKVFTLSAGKSRHMKTCMSKALVIRTAQDSPDAPDAHDQLQVQSIVTNNIENQTQHNNTTNNTTNNNNNQTNIENQVINIMVYSDDKTQNMSFKHDHIDLEDMRKRIAKSTEFCVPTDMEGVVRHYTRQILAVPENRCVQKKNVRASHTKVHVGDDNWESRQDTELYPHMMNNIANDFSEFLSENYKKKFYAEIDKFVGYIATNGHCSSNDEDKVKAIKECFNNLVRQLKLIVLDISGK